MQVRSHSLSSSVVRGIVVGAAAFVASAHMALGGIDVDGISAFAVDPTTPSTLYVGTGSSAYSIRRIAAKVVGTGTAASCTDAALNAALAGGGLVTFNCGGPATIDISTGTGTKMIAADTTIDGGGLVTISGGNTVGVFGVNSGVKFSVNNLTITSGRSSGRAGGGIFNDGGTLTVTNSTFTGNHADSAYDPACDCSGGALGGGIYNQGTLSVTNSTFCGNISAQGGGGIFNDAGTLTVTNSTFAGNGAVTGGGIFNLYQSTLTVTNSTFAGNNSGYGGGIYNQATLTVTNSTFASNNSGGGGSILSEGRGASLTVSSSTFIGNGATTGGGAIHNASRPALLRNTIFANSPSGGNCSGVLITDGGHNLDDGTSCGFSTANGSLSNTNPQLDPAGLRSNGGPTQTVALCTAVGVPAGCTAASAAIDAGDETICAAAPVNNRDQRGFVRPGAGHTQCSMGAYEADATTPEACIGDCTGSQTVAVNDLITLVNIALGSADVSTCAPGVPSGGVDIPLIIQAVNNALNGCGAGVVAQFEETACQVPLPTGQTAANARCGFVTLPEDRTQLNGRTVKLAVVVLKATGAHPARDPIVYLGGGPGVAVLDGDMPSWTAAFAAPLQTTRDLVFFDQRGTGRSEPSLACPEWHQAVLDNVSKATAIDEDGARLIDAMRTCHDRLVSEGANLGAYTFAAIAADTHDLMTALGYRQWNVYGFSYGTRAALTTMRDAPGPIRSVVLDSPVPVQVNLAADRAANIELVLNTLFAACASDPGCNTAYPDLEHTFFDLVAQLNDAPAVLHRTSSNPGMVVTGDRLLLALPDILGGPIAPFVPSLIARAAAGDYALLTLAARQLTSEPVRFSYGMRASVLCSDETPFSTPDVIAAATRGVRAEITRAALAYWTNVEVEVCRFWGAKPPAAIENTPVVSSLPTMIFTGEYDWATVPPYGPLAAQTLSRSSNFLFRNQGHGQIYGLYNPTTPGCGIRLMAEFFADPTHIPDGSCVATLPPRQYFLGI